MWQTPENIGGQAPPKDPDPRLDLGRRLKDARLSGNARAMVYVLLSYADHSTWDNCWPSQQTLADALGINVRNVRRILDRIESARIITITRKGRAHRYAIVRATPDAQRPAEDVQSSCEGAQASAMTTDVLAATPDVRDTTPGASTLETSSTPRTPIDPQGDGGTSVAGEGLAQPAASASPKVKSPRYVCERDGDYEALIVHVQSYHKDQHADDADDWIRDLVDGKDVRDLRAYVDASLKREKADSWRKEQKRTAPELSRLARCVPGSKEKWDYDENWGHRVLEAIRFAENAGLGEYAIASLESIDGPWSNVDFHLRTFYDRNDVPRPAWVDERRAA